MLEKGSLVSMIGTFNLQQITTNYMMDGELDFI